MTKIDIIEKLEIIADLDLRVDGIPGHLLDTALEGAKEIRALRNFLEIALDAYEDDNGVMIPERNPRHWTVQARKRLPTEVAENLG